MIHYNLTELEIINLNNLHKIEKCGTCKNFNTKTNFCSKFNRIHSPNAIGCK